MHPNLTIVPHRQRAPRLRLVAPPPLRAPEPEGYLIHNPPPNVPGDDLRACLLQSDALTNTGIKFGDMVIAFRTDDLQPGDLAYIASPGIVRVGIYYPAPGGWHRLESTRDFSDVTFYRPGEVNEIGRVLWIERSHVRVNVHMRLRPACRHSI